MAGFLITLAKAVETSDQPDSNWQKWQSEE
jgi:hypothetical protein